MLVLHKIKYSLNNIELVSFRTTWWQSKYLQLIQQNTSCFAQEGLQEIPPKTLEIFPASSVDFEARQIFAAEYSFTMSNMCHTNTI